jgi:putative AdoMet-dependent methyltransferase
MWGGGEMMAQVLLQLMGDELAQALPWLERGEFGLEVLDFASPALLEGDWMARLGELQALCRRLPGPISMHGPFLDLRPASPEPRLRDLTRQRYRQALEIAHELDARYLVLHTQFDPNVSQPNYPQLWLEGTLGFFRELLPEIKAAGTTILLENMWDRRPDVLAELLQQLPPEQFAACLDVGHAHLHSAVGWADWISALGERLVYVHLSDNEGEWDQHLPLGRGTIRFPDFLPALQELKRDPWFVLEVKRWREAQESLAHLGWWEGDKTSRVMDARGFDEWAPAYDASVRSAEARDEYPFAAYQAVLDEVLDQVQAVSGKRVLDLGFGTATLTEQLYAAGYSITGIDFSSEMIRIAQAKMPQATLLAHDFAQGLPADFAGNYDAVLFTYSIHHLPFANQIRLLNQLRQHLSRGGKIIIGDVMTKNAAEMEAAQAKDDHLWDYEESYPIAEELQRALPWARVTFYQKSYCSGVLVLEER